jgi:hypothetical protein
LGQGVHDIVGALAIRIDVERRAVEPSVAGYQFGLIQRPAGPDDLQALVAQEGFDIALIPQVGFMMRLEVQAFLAWSIRVAIRRRASW